MKKKELFNTFMMILNLKKMLLSWFIEKTYQYFKD